MEREILFRGKTCNQYNENDNGIWLEAFLSQNMDHGRVYPVITDGLMVEMEVIPETVGQFIGSNDATGNEKVFTGDLLKFPSGLVLEVFFNENILAYQGRTGKGEYYNLNMELALKIGNVHDNQELLKND